MRGKSERIRKKKKKKWGLLVQVEGLEKGVSDGAEDKIWKGASKPTKIHCVFEKVSNSLHGKGGIGRIERGVAGITG